MVEYIDICDENGNLIGLKLPRSEVNQNGLYHKVVRCWIVDCNGNVLIQKRSHNKEIFPSLFDASCSGHVESGMDTIDTAIKEIKEELNLTFTKDKIEYIFTYNKNWDFIIDNSKHIFDRQIVDNFLITMDTAIDINNIKINDEVDSVKLISHHQLKILLRDKDKSFMSQYDSNFDDTPYNKLFNILNDRYPYNKQ